MKQAARPAIFKGQQTEPELILCAVRWSLRDSLSFRDVEELLSERGLEADHTTIWRWVQRYGPELEERLRRHLKPPKKSWRVDETYGRVKGRWCDLSRAIDWRWCTNRNWHATVPTTGASSTDGVGSWAAHVGHRIQHIARELCVDRSPTGCPGSKTLADDRRIPEEGVLDSRVLLVA